MKGNKIIIYSLLFFCLLEIGCTNKNVNTESKSKVEQTKVEFRLPDIPVMLTSPQERADYLIAHYWDHFNFKDTMLVHKPEVTEQAFVDYIDLFPNVSQEKVKSSIRSTIQLSSEDSVVRKYFTGLFEKYLNEPNSLFRNEELYISALESIVASERFSELEKIRPQTQLDNLYKNRVGSIASDFTFTEPSGKSGRLSNISAEYLLLYFYNPDCHACKETQQAIETSENLMKLQAKNSLRVLAIYIDDDLEVWRNYAQYLPKKWINGQNELFRQNNNYYLQAIPTLYLLDRDKKVLLKDATIAQIEYQLGL